LAFNKSDKKSFFSPNNVNAKTLHKNLEFTAREQYKLLRTNLSFTLPEEDTCHIIGITSSMRGEGKSTTAVNLSYVLAESGKKVLLIDGDLRIPSIARKMKIDSTPGLTDLLKSGADELTDDFNFQRYNNWYIMPAGDLPPNPSELLGSNRMGRLLEKLKESFDYIVIDLPPVNLVSDALAISKFLSGMIVVIREEYTEKKELENCISQIRLSNVNVLGCVMNETQNGRRYYSKYKYKRYYKYYSNYGYGK